MRHRTHRSDLNQRKIIRVLRKIGCWVECIGRPFDLLVGRKMVSGEHRVFLVEIKNPDEPTAKLTKAQNEWIDKHGIEYVNIIETEEEAIRAVTKPTTGQVEPHGQNTVCSRCHLARLSEES